MNHTSVSMETEMAFCSKESAVESSESELKVREDENVINSTTTAKKKKRKNRKKMHETKKTFLCHCGHTEYEAVENHERQSCGKQCGKELSCQKHVCQQVCHSGPCPECPRMFSQQCVCGKTFRDVFCKESTSNYYCGLICNNKLNCGNHCCEQTCHRPPCPPCPLLPSKIRLCPCEAVPLTILLPSNQSRKFCLDPVPTCGRKVCTTDLLEKKIKKQLQGHGGTSYSGPTSVDYSKCLPCSMINASLADQHLQRHREFEDQTMTSITKPYFPRRRPQLQEAFDQVYSDKFRKENSYRRWIIHLLAPKYGCTSESHDTASGRCKIVSRTRHAAKLPPTLHDDQRTAYAILHQDRVFVGCRFYKRGWKDF